MKRKSSDRSSPKRSVALCYIRLSFTRDADDTNSPDRQRANIQVVCNKYGWTPEWYEDVGGHKSGRYEKNRPQWLALKARLGDPDVIALIANDLSRLHRKGWRVGDLIEYLNECGVNLVLAAPGREIDTTTMKGRMFLQFGAIVDEYYAEDISQRAKDNIAYRKGQGKSIGMTPFGTIRNADGYLTRSPEGAWVLPNGSLVAGTMTDNPPQEGAIWRSYYEAAEQILRLYATGGYGLERIAYQLNNDGWAFRDRTGTPRPINRDDARRVIANWSEYGGMRVDRKAKDRPAYEKYNVDELPLRSDRALFPLELIRAVAKVRQERTMKPIDRGEKLISHPYPLSVITYCAHCENQAREKNQQNLRTTLTGRTERDGTRRYRHRRGVNCGCINQSVESQILEQDFSRLIKLLTVTPKALALMQQLARELKQGNGNGKSKEDVEREKQEAIALCRRRIDAAVTLFGDGMINKDDYRRRIEANEREIVRWEAKTSGDEQIAIELAMCMEAIDRLSRLWDASTDEDKQGITRSLFEYIVYDLDRHRILSFRLKSWADQFVILRGKLYEDEIISYTKENSATVQGLRNVMPHREFESLFWP